MTIIGTLTMNPTIDVSYDIEHMRHTHKMRTQNEWYAPGGGGINVARVLSRLGDHARCYYLSGGPTGPALDGLIAAHKLDATRIPITGPTRIASAVLEHATGKEYRLTPAGPRLAEQEWRACIDMVAEAECKVMVLSGSLPPGVPEDFYGKLARRLHARGIEIVLDTSGAALAATLDAAAETGGLALVKPSQGELQALVGRTLGSVEAITKAAMDLVANGKAHRVAVTMGHKGAVLARKDGAVFLPALKIEAASAVGAGDSFVAGMVHGICDGLGDLEAFRLGMAAGSAAVLRAGTGLAQPADIERLLKRIDPL